MNLAPYSKIRIFLGLGSNLGDREANLREAIARLEKIGLQTVRASSIYETEPVGYADQDWFLNQVIEIRFTDRFTIGKTTEALMQECEKQGEMDLVKTFLAEELLNAMLKIENRMGRQRSFPNAPRVMDIDLLFFGELTIARTFGKKKARAEIVIPHPRLHLRRFVLEPLNEIAPQFAHLPGGKTIAQLLAQCPDQSAIKVYRKS